MKKVFICLSFVAILPSCDSISNEVLTKQDHLSINDNDFAIEITADYILSSYHRLIDESTDSCFIDNETRESMKRSKIYQKNISSQTKSVSAIVDTLTLSEKIPYCAEIFEQTLIYEDGHSEYVQITELDPEMNPLLGFHETELDLSHCVAS